MLKKTRLCCTSRSATGKEYSFSWEKLKFYRMYEMLQTFLGYTVNPEIDITALPQIIVCYRLNWFLAYQTIHPFSSFNFLLRMSLSG